ncbi:hypothetical protein POTOM_055058 [Populus tomentosa]|uniref:Uncharacterized protein n=1 Tax=Populus tomentosa TaxID=118781 RepID=A0A8X7Y0F9_POPTO|nr:hypothetical protein POTOM_055058 [Populus tomentosa]
MQALSPQLKEEKDADSWSNPDGHAQVANMVEFKVDEDAYDVSLNHRWDRYTIYSAFPGEEESLVGYEVEKALAVALEIIAA